MSKRATQPIRALVTGASGFVGSRLCRALVAQGFEVTAVTIPDCRMDELEPLKEQIRIYVHEGKTESLVTCMQESRPEIVFHLASLFLARHQTQDVSVLLRSNVEFGAQVAEAAAVNKVRGFVNTGTSWQHYKSDVFLPVNLYAATKQAFEDVLQYYVDATPMRAITLKLGDTYGPNDPRPKLLNLLKQATETGEFLDLSPGEQRLDLVHVDDVVAAYTIAAARLLAGKVVAHETYAVTSRRPMPLKSIVELAQQIWKKPVRIKWGGRPYRPREVMTPWTGGDLLPGWKPQIDLETGLRQLGD
jgi:nucleoside-diphosphate-sugar epimerase